MKLIIVGTGRMGQLIRQKAEDAGHEVLAMGDVLSPGDVPALSAKADAIIDFSHPDNLDWILSLSGTMLPMRFRAIVERFADEPAAMRQAGIAYATEQIIDLIANGVNHVHIYTMNKPDVAGAIFANLSEIYKRR